jgi:IS605 OrfB family transposase
LEEAGLSPDQWREQYRAKRMFLTADGEKDKKYGNETIRVGLDGSVVIKLPPALRPLANQGKDHYKLNYPVRFAYRQLEWLNQVANNRPVSYSFRLDPIKHKWFLAASWTGQAVTVHNAAPNLLAIDLNADHLSARVIDRHGNPVGEPITIPLGLKDAKASKRDGLLRAAITQAIHIAKTPELKIGKIVIEDLGFEDAKGREKFGHNKVFRATISGFPNGQFKERARAMIARAGLELWVVDPAYTSQWGKQHWQKLLSTPTHQATTHEAAAVVIGRRQLGYRARTRTGVGVGEQSISHPSLPSAPGQGPNSAPGATPPDQPGIAQAKKTSPGRADQPAQAGGDRCLPPRFFAPENSSVRFVRF